MKLPLRGRWLFASSVFMLGISAVQAAGPYLHGFDGVALLPPPPALHSPEDAVDRDAAFGVYSVRTPGDVARGMSEHKVTVAAFATAIGPVYRPGKFRQLDALIQEVDAEVKPVVDEAKDHWKRPRPFVDDPVRFSDPGDPENTPGYPSGHSTRGTAFALILAEIFPERRAAILEKGRLIGWTRVELGVHTPMDIYAGRVLGQALAWKFLRDPAFQQDLEAVKAEVAAANGKSP